MVLGIVTGSGTHSLPGLEVQAVEEVETPYGRAPITQGELAGARILHISRHGENHAHLSNHVNHRANLFALKQLGADCAIGCTACGAVDGDIPLGSLVFFDDLHFPVNRLPDGSLCTFYDRPGDRRRGHWIYDGPYCEPLRRALVRAAETVGVEGRDGGCYGHVDGPRFNTRTEIAALAAVGVTAVSQTAGAETVLAGELELPYTLMGFATDYANGVKPVGTPVDELISLMAQSGARFAAVIAAALPELQGLALPAPGIVYRLEG